MYHVIHQSTWDYYCLFGVDGELPNSFKKTDLSNLWKYHIPSWFFFLSSRPMTLVSFFFLPCFELCPPRVCTLLSFWSINSSQYHVIVNHVTVFSVLVGKSKVELCDPQCKIWVLISKEIVNPLRKVPIPIYRCHICALYVTYNFYRGVIGGGIGGYRYRGIIGE